MRSAAVSAWSPTATSVATHGAHHLVAERRGGHVTRTSRPVPASDERRRPRRRRRRRGRAERSARRGRPARAPAQRAEVVLAEDGVGGLGHRADVERAGDVPREPLEQRRGDAAPRGRGSGTSATSPRAARRTLGRGRHDRTTIDGASSLVQDLATRAPRSSSPSSPTERVGEVDVDDLAECVDAGVGAPRADERRRRVEPEHRGERTRRARPRWSSVPGWAAKPWKPSPR